MNKKGKQLKINVAMSILLKKTKHLGYRMVAFLCMSPGFQPQNLLAFAGDKENCCISKCDPTQSNIISILTLI